MNFSDMSWSQKLTLGVTGAFLLTSAIHLQAGRKALGLMFAGYSIANMGAFALEV